MPGQVYNIPIIQPDLRREETIHQIADTLEYLERISNDVFERIESRVTENQERLTEINKRLDVAQLRVDKIKNSRKAIKVFSSAKYPAPDKKDMYKSVFSGDTELSSIPRPSRKLSSKHQTLDSRALKEKLQFYNVQLNVRKKDKDGENTWEGLGGLPRNIASVTSLLLFNTSENPYKKYVMIDPLGAVTKTRKAIEEEQEEMGQAPTSILQREQIERMTSDNFFYVPHLGEVPDIDVPSFLPDLPGIADDIIFSGDQESSIAPSLPGANIPELPSVISSQPSNLPALPGPEGSSSVPAIMPPGMDASAPPPPPPPPPPDAAAAPPPPPPPPPVAVETGGGGGAGAGGSGGTASTLPPALAEPSGARSDLLASIRNAGGVKNLKKSVRDRKKDRKREKEQAPPSGGGDLLSDLTNMLAMRRRGISGNKQGGGGGGGGGSGSGSNKTQDGLPAINQPPPSKGNAMDRLANMIPPPPRPPGGGSGGDDDDDWD
ncbi:WASH complex subunit 1-like [Diadema antillarum]|uniref:WASH complex subunit 1-like n=1 Tax=Diadema antillarum TaxID=105358 RepID=UPI003A8BE9DE